MTLHVFTLSLTPRCTRLIAHTIMHLSSVFALTSLAAAAPSALTTRQSSSVDISGSYWDATIKYQSGRPGFQIRDLNVNFHNPKFEQVASGLCHYSFVPQGTSPPAVTDTCSEGLKYTWNCKSKQKLYPTYYTSAFFALKEDERVW